MTRQTISEKIFVLGVDGMDPRLTKKYMDEGKMPNVKKFVERGSARENLGMLGANPTVTPPMWATMSTGAYPMTHGITGFFRHSPDDLEVMQYNLDSRLCQAEHAWNCFAEAGKKTLVWHWPGASWPPTSDSENLYVVDGTTPGSVNMGPAQVEDEYVLGAGENIKEATILPKVSGDVSAPCVINGLEAEDDGFNLDTVMKAPDIRNFILAPQDGSMIGSDLPVDVIQSPIRPAEGWAKTPPAGTKEFTILLSTGRLRRPCQILQDSDGVYRTVTVYKNKKNEQPLVILPVGELAVNVRDVSIDDKDKTFEVVRNLKVLHIAPDASELKMWISAANDITNDNVFHPKRIYADLVACAGYPIPTTQIGGHDPDFTTGCTLATWDAIADWQAACLHHMIEAENIEVIFSHFHNVDLQSHKFVNHMTDKGLNRQPESVYRQFMEDLYVQTDHYLGQFLHLLDEGWTIFIVSDHAQVCPKSTPIFLGDILGVNVRVMEELGYTTMKKDANGNTLREIDWPNTKALAIRENDIYINLKGRDKHGIIDPEDMDELMDEIITALYSYKHPKTGHRVVSLALKNHEAAVLGLGGPECGDIIYFTAEGCNYDHADSLSTTLGECDTSVAPIFIAAGPGVKAGFESPRVIRQVDVAPTVAYLGGVRMPNQCEGAIVYQILEQPF